jgi:hypothetical protein
MKILRVPWIRCRADELSAIECEMSWRGRSFTILASSESEARAWWRELGETERNELMGMGQPHGSDELSLF